MSFEKCFQTASLSLLLSGFLSILLTGKVGIPVTILFLTGLFWGWFRRPKKIRKIYQWLITGLILSFFFLDLLLLSGLVGSVIRLMLALILLKVFTREDKRDYSILYLLSFSLLLIAATATISAMFVLSAAAVLFSFVLSLALFEMREAYQADPGLEFSLRKSIQTALAMTLCIILLAVPIFLIIPRSALGMFGQTQAPSIGFSPTVTLGDMGEMLQNGKVVMRVEVAQGRDAVHSDMKWRGVAMDRFDGRNWSNTVGGAREIIPDPQGRYLIQTDRFQDEVLIEQSIYLEPISGILFTSHNPIQLSGFDRTVKILHSGNQGLYIQPKPNKAFQYTLFSDSNSRTRKIKSFDQDSPQIQSSGRYLQLPDIDPRIEPLTETIVQGATSRLAEVLLLENFLKTRFEYSLHHQTGNSSDPLGNFLFNTRTGHCEYFATACVIMLRSLGIPARLINGFRIGEYNEWGDYFIVRQSDAHSWVEAYLPGSGWVDFDPTPARPDQGNFSVTRLIGKILDNLDILWTEIVTFDRYKQFGFFRILVREVSTRWENISASTKDFFSVDYQALVMDGISIKRIVIATAGFLIIGFTLGLLWFRRIPLLSFLKRRFLRLGPNEMVREYYIDMLNILKRKGFEKLPAETPGEYLSRIKEAFPDPNLLLITDIYLRTRFGGALAESSDLKTIAMALKELQRRKKVVEEAPLGSSGYNN